jgi:hypothetical protein
MGFLESNGRWSCMHIKMRMSNIPQFDLVHEKQTSPVFPQSNKILCIRLCNHYLTGVYVLLTLAL